MSRNLSSVLLMAMVLLLAGRDGAWAQAEAAIRRLPVEDWCRADATHDLEAKMRLFTTDAVLMPPGEEPLIGEKAIRQWHEYAWKGAKHECTGTVDEVQVFGDVGFVRGTFAGVMTPTTGGTAVRSSGKFLDLVRRQSDGSWKISRGIWNLDREGR